MGKIAAFSGELGWCCLSASEAVKALEMANANIALSRGLREEMRGTIDTQAGKLEELTSALETKKQDLLRFRQGSSAGIEQVKVHVSQGVAPIATDEDREDVVRPWAKVVSGGEVCARTTSTSAYSKLPAEVEEYKSRCEELTSKNQCISGLESKAKELRVKVFILEKALSNAKSAVYQVRPRCHHALGARRSVPLRQVRRSAP